MKAIAKTDLKALTAIATSFGDVSIEPHFDKISFRIHKKIFATFHQDKSLVCVKLTEIDQSVFSAFDNTIIYPVPNSWGKQGWTYIDLHKVRKSVLKDALKKSYELVAGVKTGVKTKSK